MKIQTDLDSQRTKI